MNTNHTKAAPVDLGVSAPSGDRRYPSTTKLKGSTIMSEEAHPIDNPGPLKMGDGIPAADLDGLIQATVPADDSRCPFRWCAPACNGVNHSWSQYVTARLGHVDTASNQIDTIGAGVSWSPDEETLPSVFVHIYGNYGRDVDSFLTYYEARRLHQALGEAIDILAGIYEAGFPIRHAAADLAGGR